MLPSRWVASGAGAGPPGGLGNGRRGGALALSSRLFPTILKKSQSSARRTRPPKSTAQLAVGATVSLCPAIAWRMLVSACTFRKRW